MTHPRFFVFLPLLVAAVLAGCGPDADDAKELAKKNARAAAPKNALALSPEELARNGIRTQKIDEAAFNDLIAATGTIQANQDRLAKVLPRSPGRLVRVEVNLGARVAAGQTLAIIESVEVGEARAAYLQAKSEAEVAAAAEERANKLFADQVIPQKDQLRARADADRARAALRGATGKLRMLGGEESANADALYRLAAPFAGTVLEKKAVTGELTQADQPLFTIADLATLWVDVDIYERDLGRVATGAQVTVQVAAYPGESFAGRLTYVGGMLDKGTRTLKSRVEVPNAAGRLKPGMFANLAIASPATRQGMIIPPAAVVLLQGQPTVFVQEGPAFEPRPVVTEALADGRLLVKSGLADDDVVVTQGAYALKARLLKSQLADD